MVTSIRRLCDRWGWSNSKVIKFLKTLENDSIIHVKSDTKKTVITIVNYSVYQGFVDEQATQKRHQNDAEATHKKKVKNNNKYNNNNIKRFTPPDCEQVSRYCQQRNNGILRKKPDSPEPTWYMINKRTLSLSVSYIITIS